MNSREYEYIKQISAAFVVLLVAVLPVFSADLSENTGIELKKKIERDYAGRIPQEWAENVPGVHTRLKTREKVMALTLDACGSATGNGFDEVLISFLMRERIPATLFINARWIDANTEQFKKLAMNPLFEIANHGLLHRPASITGRSIYGIKGTKDVSELVDEIEGNARKIQVLTGNRPRYYRSGTAYYDEVAVEISRRLEHEVVGFSILGDAGATYRKEQVKAALLKAVPGDIALLHMNHPAGQTAAGVIAAVPGMKAKGIPLCQVDRFFTGVIGWQPNGWLTGCIALLDWLHMTCYEA